MKQYLDLLKAIQEHGTHKPAARENMPGSQSLFGYQNRYDLADGFPAVTTKKLAWKSVVTELVWFLKGDSNIKFLVDNGCNIWNEDAFNYYVKQANKVLLPEHQESFETFIKLLGTESVVIPGYTFGDCGHQYGKVWREWTGDAYLEGDTSQENGTPYIMTDRIDQITSVISGLKENPESRRHVVTAIDPAHDNDLALYWCHAMFQFNCRPLTVLERLSNFEKSTNTSGVVERYNKGNSIFVHDNMDKMGMPKYKLDCQLYQRSADSVLGVPFNIASYSLLTHIIAKMCNMIPGDFIHSFGDAHIYDNHKEAVKEQLSRTPGILPTLKINSGNKNWQYLTIDEVVESIDLDLTFTLENYNPQPAIKAKLSTGL